MGSRVIFIALKRQHPVIPSDDMNEYEFMDAPEPVVDGRRRRVDDEEDDEEDEDDAEESEEVKEFEEDEIESDGSEEEEEKEVNQSGSSTEVELEAPAPLKKKTKFAERDLSPEGQDLSGPIDASKDDTDDWPDYSHLLYKGAEVLPLINNAEAGLTDPGPLGKTAARTSERHTSPTAVLDHISPKPKPNLPKVEDQVRTPVLPT